MPPILLPSAVVAVIAWASNNANISAIVGTQISASLPKEGVVFPWLTVQRITGKAQPDLPIDYARIQFNAWGGVKANGLPDWAPADLLMRTVESEVRAFNGQTFGDAHIASMAPFEGMQQLEDPDTRDARFWMDALVAVRRSDGA